VKENEYCSTRLSEKVGACVVFVSSCDCSTSRWWSPTSVRHIVNDFGFTTNLEKIKPESNAYGVSVVICVSIAICVSVSAGLRLFHGRFVSILLSVCVQARLIVGGSMPT